VDIKVTPKKTANVIIGEDTYKMRVPSVKTAEKYFKVLKDQESVSGILDLLEELGLPKSASEDLDIMQLQEILEGLTTLSKKK